MFVFTGVERDRLAAPLDCAGISTGMENTNDLVSTGQRRNMFRRLLQRRQLDKRPLTIAA